MEDFPLALVLSSQDEVFRNNNVLYRLVRPLSNGTGVQSTDKLVNVVPFRRVYTFYRKQEVIDFEQLLLARPLVLQPVLHFGRGIGIHCGACYNDESWVVMVNQTHPKILGRLQMGMDLAKQAIEKGQSVEMKFCLTDLIQRIYQEHLQQKEEEEGRGGIASQLLTMTRYTEWEYADLIIRYHGYEAKSRTRKERKHHKTFHKTWDFNDIGSHEMQWNQIGEQNFPHPPNAPVSEEELRAVLPDWTINEVSPLQEVGQVVPKQNYSYAQANHLYESFRKKKRQRHQIPTTRPSADDQRENKPHSPVAIEHDFSHGEDSNTKSLSRARMAYTNHQSPSQDYPHHHQSSPYVNYDKEPYPIGATGGYDPGDSYASSFNQEMSANIPNSSQRRSFRTSSRDEHIDANVLIQSSHYANMKPTPHDDYSHPPPNHHSNSLAIRKRDSDRSTNADSGFGDGQRSRGGSYDFNDHSKSHPKSKPGIHSYEESNLHKDDGLVNPAFHYDDVQEDAIHKHKAFVAKMLANQDNGRHHSLNQRNDFHHHGGIKEYPNDTMYADTRPAVSSGRDRTVDSYI